MYRTVIILILFAFQQATAQNIESVNEPLLPEVVERHDSAFAIINSQTGAQLIYLNPDTLRLAVQNFNANANKEEQKLQKYLLMDTVVVNQFLALEGIKDYRKTKQVAIEQNRKEARFRQRLLEKVESLK